MEKQKTNNTSLKFFPGDVNSPVRAFTNILEVPLVFQKAYKDILIDIANKKYIDFCMGWGSLLLGHHNLPVKKALKETQRIGVNFGFSNFYETQAASLIQMAFPSMEMMRFVNSGTEATMSAVRLARAFTKRKKIIKFQGCYHGHSDFLLAGKSNIQVVPTSDGIPNDFIKNTFVCKFNDKNDVKNTIEKNYKDIACVIIEPIPANMGMILPAQDFLLKLRKLTRKFGILLIFDEVVTGFRFRFGGTQTSFEITPDLTCLGKIIGAGLPIGCFGGKQEIMNLLSPLGNTFQAGTFSGNPLSMLACRNVLTQLKTKKYYEKLKQKNSELKDFFKFINKKQNFLYVTADYNMFSFSFGKKSPKNYDEIIHTNKKLFFYFAKEMLKQGILFSPSYLETNFLSVMHSSSHLRRFRIAFEKTLEKIK